MIELLIYLLMIELLFYLLIFVIIASLIFWLMGQLPIPQPVRRIIHIVLVVICCIALVYLLMAVAGMGPRLNFR